MVLLFTGMFRAKCNRDPMLNFLDCIRSIAPVAAVLAFAIRVDVSIRPAAHKPQGF